MDDKTMYSRWARYYDAIYAFKDYGDDARRVTEVVQDANAGAKTLLDIACGTGKHLELLSSTFQVEGLDANAEFLQVAQARCAGLPVHCFRMEDFDIGKKFDVVSCLFSSIGFVRTVDGLRRAVDNFARHLNPAGVLVIEPWFSKENFWPGKVNAHFVDQPELKIAMVYTTAIKDGLCILDNEFLVGTPQGMERLQETHVIGLFSPEEYREAIVQAGLTVVRSENPGPVWKRGLHVAIKPVA